MRLHRITWVDPRWQKLTAGAPFHPLHVAVDRQGGGRFDNPHLYAALYVSHSPEGAVGETFGNLSRWPHAEITRAKDGHPRCLVTVEIPDDTVLLDLDDPVVLAHLGLRARDVIRRNRDRTREVANSTWRARQTSAVAGLQWWSYWRVEWTNVVLWFPGVVATADELVDVVAVEELTPDHPAVHVAADVLPRELES
jgi:hypothetical protein